MFCALLENTIESLSPQRIITNCIHRSLMLSWVGRGQASRLFPLMLDKCLHHCGRWITTMLIIFFHEQQMKCQSRINFFKIILFLDTNMLIFKSMLILKSWYSYFKNAPVFTVMTFLKYIYLYWLIHTQQYVISHPTCWGVGTPCLHRFLLYLP